MTKLVIHLGAPSPDFEKLTPSLRRNSFLLSKRDAMARRPGQYRTAIDNALMAQSLGEFTDENRQQLLEKLILGKRDYRVLLSNSHYLEEPSQIFRDGLFYGYAGEATSALRDLFPDAEIEFLLTVQNPVSLVSDVVGSQRFADAAQVMNGFPLHEIRWSDVVTRIRAANPFCKLTLWAYEEAPVMWPVILREVSGLPEDAKLEGDLDLVAPLIGEYPAYRLRTFLDTQDELSLRGRVGIIEAFLQKFFDPEMAEQEIDLDGVGPEAIEQISAAYEADIDSCKSMDGVTVLSAY